jgi:hypothetical protein
VSPELPPPPIDPTRRPPRPAHRALGALAVVLAVLFGAWVRIDVALRIPDFTGPESTGLLRSDPALLYYLTERVVDAGGGVPDDFRADPRIEWPLATDVPARFTVGEEFLVAWLYRAFGEGAPLPLFATVVMAFVASGAALGVYGLGRELCGRVGPALLALGLYTLSPAVYRTAGFVLMREDLSLPLLAVHGWLFARAVRVRTPGAFAAAGLALGAAAATWHAMPFIAAVELGCILLWTLRTGSNPLAARGAWAFVAVLALFGVGVPVLRAHAFLLSLPMQLVWALGALALLERWRRPRAALRVAVGLGTWVAGAAAALALARLAGLGLSDYAHVLELVAAKIRYGGVLPADPGLLSFDARLMWQGPFQAAPVRELLAGTLVPGILLAVAVGEVLPRWWRGTGGGGEAVLVAFAAASAVLAWLVRRNVVLMGLAAPPAAALLLARRGLDRRPAWWAGLLLAQALLFASVMAVRQDRWDDPRERTEVAGLVAWMRAHLPPDGAVAGDVVVSTAVLAQTGHPIALQPKYESARSRRRIEAFLEAFYAGDPAALHGLLTSWRCRYLLVDRGMLWSLRYVAGLPADLQAPPPGTAAADFLSPEPVRSTRVPGFRLLYRSPYVTDDLRLFEVEPAPEPGPGQRRPTSERGGSGGPSPPSV